MKNERRQAFAALALTRKHLTPATKNPAPKTESTNPPAFISRNASPPALAIDRRSSYGHTRNFAKKYGCQQSPLPFSQLTG